MIAICIATYQRPVGLARLLHALQRQDLTDPSCAVSIIVVDNDPAKSASDICAESGLFGRNGWPLTYIHEPRVGIPFARNAGVQSALASGADLLALIDDDEVPCDKWLAELLATMSRYSAEVVTGPVLPRFETPAPDWIVGGGFFAGVRRSTGEGIDRAYTNNVLMRAEVFARVGRLFSERFVVQGEDIDFFLHATSAGCTIVWADDAIVHEWIPKSRPRPLWLVRRSYRTGMAWGRISLARELHRRKAFRGFVKGTLGLPLSLLGGIGSVVRSLQQIAVGLGYMAGRLRLLVDRHEANDAS